MKRSAVVVLLVSVVGLATFVGWQSIVRQREFARLMAEGDRALAADQTFPAVEAFSGAIALRGDSMIAHLKRGETYWRRGEMGAALRDLRTATRLDPAALKPNELLGDVNAALERYANAAASYEAYVRLDDRSPRVLYKLALARYRLGQAQAALVPITQAVGIDDQAPGWARRQAASQYLRGLCLRATGQPEQAAAALERAIRVDPDLTAAREELADLYEAIHREKEAVPQLEALATADPGQVERQVALGLGYHRAGRRDLAVTTLVQAARLHPESSEVFVAIGRIWLDAAEAQRDRAYLNKALEALLPLVRRGPATSEALLLLGRAQLLAGDTGSAERSFRQATLHYPVEPVAFLLLSQVAERVGHLATARDALVRYTALVGDGLPNTERGVRLGDLSLRLNEPAVAAEWYAKAADNVASQPQAFIRLAEIQLRLGNRAAAAEAVERGLQKDPRNAQLLAIQRQLKKPPAQASARQDP